MKRKIEKRLIAWKNEKEHKPLVVTGARQVGKTYSISNFGKKYYKNYVEINFSTNSLFSSIFDGGYEVDSIIKNISLMFPKADFVSSNTLIFFDEVQLCPKAMACLKSFALDKRYDVICSGSMMGINYNEIKLNSVGYKEDMEMQPMDFEEFLWANGYDEEKISDIFKHLVELIPFNDVEMTIYSKLFFDYLIVGGMPEIVNRYINTKNFSTILKMQKQLLIDYQEDITKYATGTEKGKILKVYNNIPYFLSKESKRYQVSKISKNARNRDYVGTMEWLSNAGIISICYCLNCLELPLKGNYNPNLYKIYFADSGLLIASLDDETQDDLRLKKNLNIYKGALFESFAAQSLKSCGYDLYYYSDSKSQIEMDFFIRDKDSLIPIEIKAKDGATASLNKLLNDTTLDEIKYGIKFADKNVGYNQKFYTLPYFTMFLLRRFVQNKN